MRSLYWSYLILGAVAVLAAVATTTQAADIFGDLVVNSGSTYPLANDDLNVYGNVLVKSGGTLDLRNVNLALMCASEGQYTLKVEAGGEYLHNGGTIGTGSSYRFKFEVFGQMTLEGVTVSNTWGTGGAFDPTSGADPDLADLRGGIQIYSSAVHVGNCTLENGLLTMVYVGSGVTPAIQGCTIRNVQYNVKSYYQSAASSPSTTRYSAMAFGVLLDGGAATVDGVTFTDIGVFSTMTSIYYRDQAVNNNEYRVIAAAVAARSTELKVESCTVSKVGVLTKASDTFDSGGNTVNQYFYQYRVAGLYGFHAKGSSVQANTVTDCSWGMYVSVDPSSPGGPTMTFDVIIDNTLTRNSMGGAFFSLSTVRAPVIINVSDNNIDHSGVAPVGLLEDCGLLVTATGCTAELKVILQQNRFDTNIGRGALVDVHAHGAALSVEASSTNVFTGNGAAGLKVVADTVTGNVRVEVTNATFSSNRPTAMGDDGALAVEGGGNTGQFSFKLADVFSTNNQGYGASVGLGSGMWTANHASKTSYTLHKVTLSDNTDTGLYIFDNYGTNGQSTTFDWVDVEADRCTNGGGVYVHSRSALGTIKVTIYDLTVIDAADNRDAVRLELAGANFNPRTVLKGILITYSGDTPSATGLSLQGTDASNRWPMDIIDLVSTNSGTALEAQYCNVVATNCNLTTTTQTAVVALDSRVDLYYCRMVELSASVTAGTLNSGVYYYRWFNISLVAWQNRAPIKNQTITIRRYNEPKEELYTAKTDAKGKLEFKQIAYWMKDDINTPLRNDVLQAFMKMANDELNSQFFDFNVSAIGIDDPSVPELIISIPAENTIQKVGDLVVQGEVRDAHSGIVKVEATIDNIVWHNATGLEGREGQFKATFRIPLTGLVDNVYTIKVRGWDVARFPNETFGVAIVEIKNVKIDTQPPFLIVEHPAQEHYVTNMGSIDIVGRTESTKFIRKLTINDIIIPILGITFNYSTPLEEGANTFIIIAEDTAGNIAVLTRQIVRDTLAPTLIVTSPTEFFSSRQQDFEVAGDSEETATVFVKLDTRADELVEIRGGTRFYHVLKINKEGTHTITVRAVDAATNEATVVRYVKYDTTPPIIDVDAPTSGQITNIQKVLVSGGTDVEVRQVFVNNLIFNVTMGRFALEINLLEGVQNLTIKVADAAGNENQTRIPISIDVTPPHLVGLTIESSEPGSTAIPISDGMVVNMRSVRFRGGLEQMDQRTLYVRVGNDNRTALWDEGGSFYREFNLDEGENIVTFFCVDIANNRETRTYRIWVDTRAPTIKFMSPKLTPNFEATTEEDTIVISGIMEEEGVSLMIQNKPVAIVPTSGQFQTIVALIEGVNNIEVTFTDPAGNDDSYLLRITYTPAGKDDSPTKAALGKLWWVFALAIAILIILPLTVRRTRGKWFKEHPELERYDPRAAREGYYDDPSYLQDQYRRGGGY